MIGRLTKFMAMRKTFVGVQAGDGRGRDAFKIHRLWFLSECPSNRGYFILTSDACLLNHAFLL